MMQYTTPEDWYRGPLPVSVLAQDTVCSSRDPRIRWYHFLRYQILRTSCGYTMLLYWSWYLPPHPVDVMVRVHLLTAPLLLYRPVAMVHQAGAGCEAYIGTDRCSVAYSG
jgi:hypothetical protein